MPTLELNINWDVFDKSQREIVEKALNNGHYEHIAAILYEVSPEQAIELEKVQRQLRPREFKFDSQEQQNFEAWSTQNFNDITPEAVAEWQSKIDAEKQAKLTAMNGGIVEVTEVKSVEGTAQTGGLMTNDLHNVKGLGEASIKRLNAANIYSVDELRKLDQGKRKEILGPLVAAKIQSLT